MPPELQERARQILTETTQMMSSTAPKTMSFSSYPADVKESLARLSEVSLPDDSSDIPVAPVSPQLPRHLYRLLFINFSVNLRGLGVGMSEYRLCVLNTKLAPYFCSSGVSKLVG